MAGEFLDELSQLWEEEGLFARDIDGQLVRSVPATRADYERDVTLTIDDREITVKKAVPIKDSQGNILEDEHGNSIPRDTTIFDAAQQLFVESPGGVNPIPILCHQEHMRPVAVCRVCTVEVCRVGRDGKVSPGGKLVPACHHPVKAGMVVHTIYSPDPKFSARVKNTVRMLTELLAADHLTDMGGINGTRIPNDFERHMLRLKDDLKINCDPERLRIAPPPDLGKDNSSFFIAVNHNACILCERCKRGCSDVKENRVIGRTGKGYTTHIAFDLNDKMGQSGCVSCGECMVYCPTDALSFRRPIESDWHKDLLTNAMNSVVTAEELLDVEVGKDKTKLFRSLPYKWLQWNAASIVRRRVNKGDLLCRQGDYGTTAFILLKGSYGVWFKDPHAVKKRKKASSNGALPPGEPDVIVGREEVILGEMVCMNYHPRTATVAATEPGEYLEIRRNVLYALQRNANAQKFLDGIYRRRALDEHMRNVSLFKDLGESDQRAIREFLSDKVELVRVDPKQTIFRQGDPVDHFYMIRTGYVKVSIEDEAGRERVITYLKPAQYFGEIGALTVTDRDKLDVDKAVQGRRTATCTALDDVELVRIKGRDFVELMVRFERLHKKFVELGKQRLAENAKIRKSIGGPLRDFLDQGLFNAQKLLVLDLNSCTRCDECVKACADTHGGISRLVREGLRFQDFLVASACRSCTDPYCLVGCPVDSIHREHSLEIAIQDHCIGCGQCATNCPYGNINMVGFETKMEDEDGQMRAVVQQQATTCDLCSSVGIDASDPKQKVSCVYACPHNAAHRMSGDQLFDIIKSRHQER